MDCVSASQKPARASRHMHAHTSTHVHAHTHTHTYTHTVTHMYAHTAAAAAGGGLLRIACCVLSAATLNWKNSRDILQNQSILYSYTVTCTRTCKAQTHTTLILHVQEAHNGNG